jgi:hypothetical protein
MRTPQSLLTLISAAAIASSSEVEVRLYNLAHQPDFTVTNAKAVVERVFGGASLRITWTAGDPDDPDAHTVDYGGKMTCADEALQAPVRVRLISSTPVSVPPFVLGVAYPCSKSGIQVTIFSDHVEALSRELRAPIVTILGYAIVHELGHVLLRSNSHSFTGIMKERWSRSDWNSATSHGLQFSEAQVAQLQRSASESLDSSQNTRPRSNHP